MGCSGIYDWHHWWLWAESERRRNSPVFLRDYKPGIQVQGRQWLYFLPSLHSSYSVQLPHIILTSVKERHTPFPHILTFYWITSSLSLCCILPAHLGKVSRGPSLCCHLLCVSLITDFQVNSNASFTTVLTRHYFAFSRMFTKFLPWAGTVLTLCCVIVL